MNRNEFIKKTEHYHGRVGDWKIVLNHLSSGDFILGCYYDNETRTWKVYKNIERGMQSIRLETTSEEEALDKIFSMIEFENKIDLHYKEWEAKKKQQQ